MSHNGSRCHSFSPVVDTPSEPVPWSNGNYSWTMITVQKILENMLVCPGCHGALQHQGEGLLCNNAACTSSPRLWPVVNGLPILLDESQSLFRIADLLPTPGKKSISTAQPIPVFPFIDGPWRRLLSRIWHFRPGLSRNVAAERNNHYLCQLLQERPQPVVLVAGCGDEGDGIAQLRSLPQITLVNLDVQWTSSVTILADAQQLPFADQSFDAVVLQGVLEHVLDAAQVEREIYRTLKNDGFIYCELPFLQPNHGGAFDLLRFTWTGHRRFWRRFTQLDAGACCGPGMALAHMIQQFARSWLPFAGWRLLSDWLTDWLFWWLKYADSWLTRTPAGLDGASAFYFLGRKSDTILSDSDLIRNYRGGQ
ncbi:methyltransferase domain-containing protein [Candidatus Magnetaquicoccus inordinatus]|uniref:methyltransferase domain-containing protein n=1 Tax=Candidatus Magnetaquicoccus inordinatus TaxID=2496818 RepID=UPI00187D5B76|nr:methyltransferase domain-containing protein [Candidatus Magnetaquicoccus inordinatus]